MARIGLSRAYRLLAVNAAEAAGIEVPAGELPDRAMAVAGSAEGRAVRDEAWLEYEQRLRDPSYTLDAIHDWLRDDRGVEVGRTSVDRDRKRLVRGEKVHKLANDRLRVVFDQLQGLSADQLYQGGVKIAMQRLLDFLLRIGADDLEELRPAQILMLIDTFGRLGKTQAETERIRTALAEKNAEAKRQIDHATRSGGTLKREDVYAILDRVMRGEAA